MDMSLSKLQEMMVKGRKAQQGVVHGGQRVGWDLVTEQQSLGVQWIILWKDM